MFHIFCFVKTKINHSWHDAHTFINSLKYFYVSIHDGHGLMMMYDIHMNLDFFNIITIDGSKYTISSTCMFGVYIVEHSSKYNPTLTKTLSNHHFGRF
jgi:hypothetical protein